MRGAQFFPIMYQIAKLTLFHKSNKHMFTKQYKYKHILTINPNILFNVTVF